MPTACGAGYFGSLHAHTIVFDECNGTWQSVVKARPATVCIKFCGAREQFRPTVSAGVRPWFKKLIILTAKWRLGRFIKQHIVLIGR